MMQTIDIVKYIFDKYPKPEELSKPRLVKIVYLIDWKTAVETGDQCTNVEWYYNHYGPYVEDVINVIKNHPESFEVTSKVAPGGNLSIKIKKIDTKHVELPKNIQTFANFIIENTWKLNWSDFINFVYSTFPIKRNPQYTKLDLKYEAKVFNAILSSAKKHTK